MGPMEALGQLSMISSRVLASHQLVLVQWNLPMVAVRALDPRLPDRQRMNSSPSPCSFSVASAPHFYRSKQREMERSTSPESDHSGSTPASFHAPALRAVLTTWG